MSVGSVVESHSTDRLSGSFAAAMMATCLLQGCGAGKELPVVPAADRRATIVVREAPGRAFPGAAIRATVQVRNDGPSVFPADGVADRGRRVNLSYHWLEVDGRVVEYEGIRTPFLKPLRPGKEATLTARILVPARPGTYLLRFDLVQEWIGWFEVPGGSVTVTVGTPPDESPSGIRHPG